MSGPPRRGGSTRRGSVIAALAALATSALAHTSARADTRPVDEVRARDAYQRGSIAYQHGDYARAAHEFADADALAPDAVTLRVALGAATLADDPVLGTELVERAARGPIDKALAGALNGARTRFAHRTGRIVARCPNTSHCLATLDGATLEPGAARLVAIGVHTVAVQGNGPLEQRMIQVEADQTVDVAATSPANEAHATPQEPRVELQRNSDTQAVPRDPKGIAPAWFFATATIAAVATGLTVWSFVDTANLHARFEDAGCNAAPGPSCVGLRSSGVSAERRSNGLLVASSVLAAGAATVGLFLVRWTAPRVATVGLFVSKGEAQLRAAF